jgi:hypothetical protein
VTAAAAVTAGMRKLVFLAAALACLFALAPQLLVAVLLSAG